MMTTTMMMMMTIVENVTNVLVMEYAQCVAAMEYVMI